MTRLIILCFTLLLAQPAMSIEEPDYTVIEQSGKLELRRYAPTIIAETQVSGSMDKASGDGFRLIADYIFGNNTAKNGEQSKISMTAPVLMEPQSEKINMTAPVTLAESGGDWRVAFVMPSQYTMETLPTPNNDQVTLREVPASDYAVVRFSGLAGEKKVAKKTGELLRWMESKSLISVGSPELARYNPPWTPPFLRRNEIRVQFSGL